MVVRRRHNDGVNFVPFPIEHLAIVGIGACAWKRFQVLFDVVRVHIAEHRDLFVLTLIDIVRSLIGRSDASEVQSLVGRSRLLGSTTAKVACSDQARGSRCG
jgi:hypothetical protein